MTRTEATTIVDDIRDLWRLAYSTEQISRGVNQPERLVQHVIDHGELPEPQLTQLNLFDGQPAPDRISQK